MSEHDVETLARVLSEHADYGRKPLQKNNADWNLKRTRYGWFCDCGHELPWGDDGPAHRRHVAEQVLAAIEEGRWAPPGAARAGDALTEAEREALVEAVRAADLTHVLGMVATFTAVERILAARAAGVTGGDLAERVRAAKAEALREAATAIRFTEQEHAEWLRERAALLDPAPRSDSKSRESEGHKFLPTEELAADGSSE